MPKTKTEKQSLPLALATITTTALVKFHITPGGRRGACIPSCAWLDMDESMLDFMGWLCTQCAAQVWDRLDPIYEAEDVFDVLDNVMRGTLLLMLAVELDDGQRMQLSIVLREASREYVELRKQQLLLAEDE